MLASTNTERAERAKSEGRRAKRRKKASEARTESERSEDRKRERGQKSEGRAYKAVVTRQGDEVGEDDEDGADHESDGGLDVKGTGVGPEGEPSRIAGRGKVGRVVGLQSMAGGAQNGEAHKQSEEGGGAAGSVEDAEGAALGVEVGVVLVEVAVLAVVGRVDLELGRVVGLLLEGRHCRGWGVEVV